MSTKDLGWVDDPVTLTQAELEELPEYSRSLPTGKTPGKRWKSFAGDVGWCIGDYVEMASEDKIGIRWRPIQLVGPGA